MKRPGNGVLNKLASPTAWLWMLSLFLVGLGARLWLVRRCGTPLPFWDQWEEARVVYVPYFEGKLSLADLFSAHNEHRVFFTRIYGLALLLLNGQWDGQLQMVGNAIIHCATMAGLGWLMFRWLERKCWILVWLPLVLVLALPFGWENSLAGFQSQFYFLLVFSLLTLWLLGLHPPGSVRWWCGAATAIMALFTVASGFLAAAAVFGLVVFRICRRPGRASVLASPNLSEERPKSGLARTLALLGLRHSDPWKPGEPADTPSPALKGTLSPSKGERDGERGPTPIPSSTPIQARGSGVLGLGSPTSKWKREAPTLAFCAAVAVAGVLLKADVRHHHLLQAHSVGEFLSAFGANLAWPWIVVSPFALLNLLPLAVLAWCYLRQTEDCRAEEMTLGLGLWTILQGAAAAYARGAEGKPPGWRYMDSSSLILVADCFSIALLLSRIHLFEQKQTKATKVCQQADSASGEPSALSPLSERRRCIWAWPAFRLNLRSLRYLLLAALVLWGAACVAGLVLLTSRAWQIDIPERQLYHRAQLQTTRAFMATDDIRVLDRKPKPELAMYEGDPYAPRPVHEGEKLAKALRNPVVRAILPACARLPLEVKADPEVTQLGVRPSPGAAMPNSNTAQRTSTAREGAVVAAPGDGRTLPGTHVTGFVPNGFRLARREPPTEVSWGSWSAQGPAARGTFESLPIPKSRLPYLEIPVAGDLGRANLSLELVGLAGGERIPVAPSRIAGEKWLNCYVKAPAGAFKIVARDASSTAWFAFKAPREVGRLSFWAIQTLSAWKYLLLAGLGLFLFNVAVLLARRNSLPVPDG